jgi:chemotaxis protein methyltransferase CheR
MLLSNMVELGIVDIREIIRLVKSNYEVDFSNFALTSLKYRLEHIIAKNNLTSPESLYRKLHDQRNFFDIFLSQLFVPSTEMFRDPSVWRWLREEYFAKQDEKALMNFKIWLPYCVSGGELYSLAVLLKELNLLEKVKVYATVFSDVSYESVRAGEYPIKKIDVSSENYKRFQGEKELESYYVLEKYLARRDTSLIKSVEFIRDDINFNNAPKNIKLIIMRNVMIYFNPTFQDNLLSIVHNSLTGGGTLIIGLKEMMKQNQGLPGSFEAVEKNEGVYKKKLN